MVKLCHFRVVFANEIYLSQKAILLHETKNKRSINRTDFVKKTLLCILIAANILVIAQTWSMTKTELNEVY